MESLLLSYSRSELMVFIVLSSGIRPRSSHLLTPHLTTELHPTPQGSLLFYLLLFVSSSLRSSDVVSFVPSLQSWEYFMRAYLLLPPLLSGFKSSQILHFSSLSASPLTSCRALTGEACPSGPHSCLCDPFFSWEFLRLWT